MYNNMLSLNIMILKLKLLVKYQINCLEFTWL